MGDFITATFHHAGLNPEAHVKIDEKYFRSTEVDYLLGDPAKAREQLDWEASTKWDTLARFDRGCGYRPTGR